MDRKMSSIDGFCLKMRMLDSREGKESKDLKDSKDLKEFLVGSEEFVVGNK